MDDKAYERLQPERDWPFRNGRRRYNRLNPSGACDSQPVYADPASRYNTPCDMEHANLTPATFERFLVHRERWGMRTRGNVQQGFLHRLAYKRNPLMFLIRSEYTDQYFNMTGFDTSDATGQRLYSCWLFAVAQVERSVRAA